MRIGFGPFAFDPESRLLWREGAEIALPPRVLGVLEVLLERAGQVVGRQDLLDRVWKDAFVTDTSLAEAVSFLRQALGDDPQSPRYIQTVHRRGYRFLAPLSPDSGELGTARGLTPESHFAVASGVRPHDVPNYPPQVSVPLELLPWVAAGVAAAFAIGVLTRVASEQAPDALVARFEVQPTAGTRFDHRAPALAVSSDGRTLAWSACEAAPAVCALYVRQVDRLDAVRLAGTDGAAAPFFSPDGRWLGFFADAKLKKVAVSGGSPVPIADAPVAGGGSWARDGRIVFNGLPAGGLSLAADEGGDVAPLTMPRCDRGELRHLWPEWTPDGRGVIFTIATSPVPSAPGQLAALTLQSRAWRTLRAGVTRAVPAGPRYLLIASGSDLQAATFDDATMALTGASDSVLDALATADGVAPFATGGGALAAIRSRPAERTIAWADAPDRAIPNAGRLAQLSLAPDGRRAAGVLADVTGSDVWIVDLQNGALSRASAGGTNVSPAWTPNGEVTFASKGRDGFFHVPGVTPLEPAHAFPASIARDGRIAILQTTRDGRVTLMATEHADGGLVPLAHPGRSNEWSAAFSPDGAWIAYESDDSGRREIYAQRIADGLRVPISNAGGERPSWSSDGRVIYFHEGPRYVRVAFDADRGPRAGSRTVVFDRPGMRVLGVSADGRLLIERERSTPDTAVVALHWLRELGQRLPQPVATPR